MKDVKTLLQSIVDHANNCRPNESGHGVTLSMAKRAIELINEIDDSEMIEFAEWTDVDCIGSVNIIGTEWHDKYKLKQNEWLYFGGEKTDPEIKTTAQLIELYRNEKQKR